MAKRPLTPKQQAFLTEYLRNGENASQAYRKAYGSKSTPMRCGQAGAELLKHPEIAHKVAAARAKAAVAVAQVQDQFAFDKARVMTEMARLSFASMRDFVRSNKDGTVRTDLSELTREQWAAVAELTTDEYMDGRGEDARPVKRVRLKLADKRAALVELARLNGWIIDRKETRKVQNWADLSEEELEALTQDGQK